MVLSLVVDGAAFERMEAGRFLVRAGQLLCLWPRQWHDVTEYEGKPLRTIHFDLDGPAVPAVAGAFGMTPTDRVRTLPEYGAAKLLFEQIVAGFHADEHLPPSHFLKRLFAVAELCMQDKHGQGGVPVREPETLVERAQRVCRTGLLVLPTVPALARRLGVCQNTLLNACRRELGITTVELLVRLKVEKARELLRTTDHKAASIAAACGFYSASHFAQCFRRIEGVSPSAWRHRSRSAKELTPYGSG
jgi:AraC-like DNA-binding protein